MTSFLDRHSDRLSSLKGKITSPTRNSDALLQNTEDFIESINMLMKQKTMNKQNIVVFDETVVGDSVSLPLVIGERKNFGGGNINVYRTRELALGSYIPFSMPDGSTPFRVFIFKTGKLKKNLWISNALAPAWEKGLRGHPHRLFLQSESGYISTELFACIMDEFTKWWTTTRPGLHCFLISDNLRVHRNEEIVEKASTKGIHMINIMPGSSHWFQVHDQLPFGNLKKKINIEKNKLFRSRLIPPRVRRALLMGIFYRAEAHAMAPHILRKSFEDVGLWPWNPQKILEACQRFCPAVSLPDKTEEMKDLKDVITRYNESGQAACDQLIASMKPATITFSEKKLETEPCDKECRTGFDKEEQTNPGSIKRKSEHVSLEQPRKRIHRIPENLKQCSVKGCQKTHFWSTKWFYCSKCNKHFCPSHAGMICHPMS